MLSKGQIGAAPAALCCGEEGAELQGEAHVGLQRRRGKHFVSWGELRIENLLLRKEPAEGAQAPRSKQQKKKVYKIMNIKLMLFALIIFE